MAAVARRPARLSAMPRSLPRHHRRAHWVDASTMLWGDAPEGTAISLIVPDLVGQPQTRQDANPVRKSHRPATRVSVALAPLASGPSSSARERFPHLASLPAFTLPAEFVRARDGGPSPAEEWLRGPIEVIATRDDGTTGDHGASRDDGAIVARTGVQIAGVLDDLFATDHPLGLAWNDGAPSLFLWAPTARSVRLLLYRTPTAREPYVVHEMTRGERGVFGIEGERAWNLAYYLYEVEVWVPARQAVVRNRVTDPYSRSLSGNSRRSQIVDLGDPALQPRGWQEQTKPTLRAFEDIVLYELHVRDFSALDASTPEHLRGTYLAFTVDSAPTRHLRRLADAGVTHVHLLPIQDFATVDEERTTRERQADAASETVTDSATEAVTGTVPRREAVTASRASADLATSLEALAALPPDSTEQQARLAAQGDGLGYNWGYDPFHYGVPEGSYATVPDGPARIVEVRRMVQALAQLGLRVVLDVVYNHTYRCGQSPRAVLDRIVPGYYHRLDANGRVVTTTCCANTASEHVMMERLIGDDLVHWARNYRVDGFRFDLMGHHLKRNLLYWQERLRALRPETDGIDGRELYLYGEGWDFGEVQGGQRGENASQVRLAGTGIGTFNDRIRDALRGGSPFSDPRAQGFATGLHLAPAFDGGGAPTEETHARLGELGDRLRIALAGNLRDFRFGGRHGQEVRAGDIYLGGYADAPWESVQYVSAHDNDTLFDKIALTAPANLPLDERIRMQVFALSFILLAQGIPFLHAGAELLRSKSGDCDSYRSGDWFNQLDVTGATHGFGRGLPPAKKNQGRWDLLRPLLARRDLVPSQEQILSTLAQVETFLRIRRSSSLFRLPDLASVQHCLRFLDPGSAPNSGGSMSPEGSRPAGPEWIVMLLSPREAHRSEGGARTATLCVLFHAGNEAGTFAHPFLRGCRFALHPEQAAGPDPRIREEATFDPDGGTFRVPGWSTAVFVQSTSA